jgi:signal transduction histidine kinase
MGRYLFEDPRRSLWVSGGYQQVIVVTTASIGVLISVLCESLRMAAIEYARSYQMALEADARKDEFLAMLGHELRNPLAPIRHSLYLLDRMEVPNPLFGQLRQIMTSQVEHLTRLVNDLLDVSRFTRGKIDLNRETIDLRKVVDLALDVARPLIEEKGQTLQVNIPTCNYFLNADPVRLTQVLTNLLNNAAKYTPAGGQIWLTAETSGNAVAIRVRDNGIGLSADACKGVFDLFMQVDHSIERTSGGLGVGLTLVKWLIEKHGGTIEVSSPGLGLGSEFTVRLPSAPRPAELPKVAPPLVPHTGARGPLKILVVDDLEASANSLSAVLKIWNHDVEIAYDAFSAVEKARAFRPDVILSDLGLPQMNGYQLAEQVRSVPELSKVVLIAVSGYGQPLDLKRSEEAGFVQHLIKPIDPRELENILAGVGT